MEIDEKSKQVTLRHMNADHRLDLGLYLRYVNGLSAEQLAAEGEPEMLDIDLASITIRTAKSGRVHTVLLQPPMANWPERRVRLVSLALEARAAFGVPLPEHGEPAAAPASSGPVAFRWPTGLGLVSLFGVLSYIGTLALVLSGHDGLPAGFRRIVRAIALPVAVIHLGEMWWLDRSRLVPHGMRRGSRDWTLWMASNFLEGFFAFLRFDRAVQAAKRAEAKAAKH